MTDEQLDLACRCDSCGAFFPPDQLESGRAVVVRVEGRNAYKCAQCAPAAGDGLAERGRSG
jgi:hypothetical protein